MDMVIYIGDFVLTLNGVSPSLVLFLIVVLGCGSVMALWIA